MQSNVRFTDQICGASGWVHQAIRLGDAPFRLSLVSTIFVVA
jgi:hypothetical protein